MAPEGRPQGGGGGCEQYRSDRRCPFNRVDGPAARPARVPAARRRSSPGSRCHHGSRCRSPDAGCANADSDTDRSSVVCLANDTAVDARRFARWQTDKRPPQGPSHWVRSSLRRWSWSCRKNRDGPSDDVRVCREAWRGRRPPQTHETRRPSVSGLDGCRRRSDGASRDGRGAATMRHLVEIMRAHCAATRFGNPGQARPGRSW